ncbi:LysR substrate-binding domain-containing protein [Streptomyces sp. NPDC050534]|uniref:LysR substrate-binding domain-containing protein n=1 Tax=Streptomyces sp. NPDC050534 TaxID=3365625 RepID=UPI0037B1BCCB
MWSGAYPLPPQLAAHPLSRDPLVLVLPPDHPLAKGPPPNIPLRLEQLRHEGVAVSSTVVGEGP